MNDNDKYLFQDGELTEIALLVYQDSNFIFWKIKETFYCALDEQMTPIELGSLKEVNDFLEAFYDEMGV